MKVLKLLFYTALIVFLNIQCSNNDDNDNDSATNLFDTNIVYKKDNISYGSHQRQKLDLYLPANRNSATKTLILVHGGGWTSGDKKDMDAIKQLITNELNGIAVASINYRLADENNKPYPMQLEDISQAVAFLKENKSQYSISEDIGFIGISAGAHLSLLWSYAFDTNKNVNMVCSIVGPTNFTDPAYTNNTNAQAQELIDLFAIDSTTDFLEKASPFHQATSTSPPTILFYGGKDPLIPTTQGTDLQEKLESLNVTHGFTLYPEVGHGWEGVEFLDTWTKLKLFIDAHL